MYHYKEKDEIAELRAQLAAAKMADDRARQAAERENWEARRQRRKPDRRFGERWLATDNLRDKLSAKLSWAIHYQKEAQDRLRSLPAGGFQTPRRTNRFNRSPESTRVGVANRFTSLECREKSGDSTEQPGF